MSDLTQILYVSAASKPLEDGELQAILAKARPANEKRGITGLLVYSDGNFLQVIEGAADVTAGLFNRIRTDPRHRHVLKLLHQPIEERAFPDWSMGYKSLSAAEASQVPGYADWVSGRDVSPEVLEGLPQKLQRLISDFKRINR